MGTRQRQRGRGFQSTAARVVQPADELFQIDAEHQMSDPRIAVSRLGRDQECILFNTAGIASQGIDLSQGAG
jgi:hypothetical protein